MADLRTPATVSSSFLETFLYSFENTLIYGGTFVLAALFFGCLLKFFLRRLEKEGFFGDLAEEDVRELLLEKGLEKSENGAADVERRIYVVEVKEKSYGTMAPVPEEVPTKDTNGQ